MNDETINYGLKILNYYFGGLVVLTGLYKYSTNKQNRIPLYVALAIIIVGPVENILNSLVKSMAISSAKQKVYHEMVDQATSLTFLILLGFVVRKV